MQLAGLGPAADAPGAAVSGHPLRGAYTPEVIHSIRDRSEVYGDAAGEASQIGSGGTLPPLTAGGYPCPDANLLWNVDPPGPEDTGAFAWQYGGVVAPDYGAFAEGHTAEGTVCGMRLWLTTLPDLYQGQTPDAYVYDSDGTNPTSVLSLVVDVSIDPPGNWPELTERGIGRIATASDPTDRSPDHDYLRITTFLVATRSFSTLNDAK